MDLVELTNEQRDFFEANGYLIVPGALSPDAVAAITAAADPLMADHEDEGYYQHRRYGLMQVPVLAQLATASPLLSLVAQILGTHIHITNTALIYKRPQSADGPVDCNWHRDVGVHLDLGAVKLPRVGLKVGYCLTDTDAPQSGATLFAPGSNRLEEPLAIPQGQNHPQNFIEPQLKAGDAFLFESRIYHCPGINTRDQVAKVAMFGYHYIWVKPDYYLRYYDGEPQPSEAVLANLDDVGRQLLGATTDAKGRQDVNGIDWPIAEWAKEQGLSLERAPQLVEAV